MKTFIAALCGGFIFTTAVMVSAEPLASVVTVRGKATVARGTKKLDAQPKLGLELQDTVATAEGGRVKMLFIDDSVLTLAEKTSMSIDTFVHSRSDRGDSLFNLLDGKMRAVVGKTRFEVKTPTVVAAARGTVILFDVGTLNGKSFTRVTCLEGIVDVRLLKAAPGTKPTLLSPGQSLVVAVKLPAAEQKTATAEQKPASSDQKTPAAETLPAVDQKTTAAETQPAAEQKSASSDQKTPVAETQNDAVKISVVTTATDSTGGGTAGVTAKLATVELLPEIKVEKLTPAEIVVLKRDTNIAGTEIKLPPLPAAVAAPAQPRVIQTPIVVPVIPVIPQQPVKTQPTRVDIGVKF